ncbi:MAG: GNAT family N-acetyltransferase [Ilumatobacteraceae bacterium]
MTARDSVRYIRISAVDTTLIDHVAEDVFDDAIDPHLLRASLERDQLLVVAMTDGMIVGQLQAMVQDHLDGPSHLYIDNLGVSPAYRRRGIGAGLVASGDRMVRRARLHRRVDPHRPRQRRGECAVRLARRTTIHCRPPRTRRVR